MNAAVKLPCQWTRACVAALLVAAHVLVPSTALAVGPDVLPEPLWWRSAALPALATRPLGAIGALPRVSLSSEWAPLYSAPDGAKLEHMTRALRIASPAGRYRLAVEAREGGAIARGGASAWSVGAERPIEQQYAVALAGFSRRADAAVALSANSGRPGYAADAVWKAMPGLALGGGASRSELSGQALVRWGDTEINAGGRWRDEAAHASLWLASASGTGLAVSGEWLERGPASGGDADRLAPRLSWRTGKFSCFGHALGSSWRASFEAGTGVEALQVLRADTPYLTLVGPVSNRLVNLDLEPGRAPITLRAWTGSWRGAARGSLALWPFDALGALSGTRRIVHSEGALEHWGVAMNVGRPAAGRVDGGLALWSLAPRASYDSWQGSLFGLVQDDKTSGVTSLRSVLALGARLGLAANTFGTRCRVEAVQWVPVSANRELASAGGSSPGGTPGSSASASGRARGGTILRVSIEALR